MGPAVGFVLENPLVSFFSAVFMIHAASVIYVTGDDYIYYTALYGVLVWVSYLSSRSLTGSFVSGVTGRVADILRLPDRPLASTLVDIFVFLFPVVYFGVAGRVPAYDMLLSADYFANAGLRHEFHDGIPTLLSYAGEYYIKAIAPLWLLYSFIFRRKAYWLLAVYLGLFALGMITKSVVVIIFVPTLLFQVFGKKLAHAAITALIILGVIYGNILLQDKSLSAPLSLDITEQSPHITEQSPRPSDELSSTEEPAGEASLVERASGVARGVYVASEAILARLFYKNGLTVKFWMESYSTDFPSEKGCGYRWYASLVGCEFVYIPEKIWLKYFPELHARGIGGSVSAANYINGYANFGTPGVLASGVLTGLLLALLTAAFPNPVTALAVNAAAIALTFENTLSILLNSGGWGLFVALAVLFLPRRATEYRLRG
ncbi:hypothetical protein PRN20_04830 [Devosia sp. ZB163]|uniref:hypothetical protein n=1 Tax=Devosia sp. ZB163 TaxID=3025938 RepID=UPI002360E91F|nr:hypothetical protein [Devosia sp. ZB163]MDC9823048.1 hypothetical protein [Devosia sp. ZB163]